METISAINGNITGILENTDDDNPTRGGSFKDDYQLTDLTVGELVEINLTAGFDTFLQLVNEDTEEVIFSDDDGGDGLNSRLRFVVEEGINYLVRATSFGSGATGNYTLTSNVFVPPDVDLEVTEATAPTEALIGDSIEISYSVTNNGTEDANGDEFGELVDAIYLSDDENFDSDDELITDNFLFDPLPLEPGASYEESLNITLRANLDGGDKFLLVVANDINSSFEGGQLETDRSNNTFALPISLSTPDVDLVVEEINAPTTALVGDTIDISYIVTNNGEDPANGDPLFNELFDEIYISDDETLDDGDTFLNDRFIFDPLPLEGGASYTENLSVNLSSNLNSGEQFLIVATDRFEEQVETDNDNNTLSIPISLSTPDVDLVVTEANAPDTAIINSRVPISWTVTNNGSDPANGSGFFSPWFDQVYFSDDEVFDFSDSSLTSFSPRNFVPLEGGDSYSVELNPFIFNFDVTPGEGFLLFVTDSSEDQVETDNDNNTVAIPITFARGLDLSGTDEADTLEGSAGIDTISGGDGDDSIIGFSGRDRLFGEAGNDTLIGNRDDDTLRGGDGDDFLNGGPSRDRLFGESGNDNLKGSSGRDTLFGGGGNDALLGNSSEDVLNGGDGNDTLRGGSGFDILRGGAGNDVLTGGSNSDTLRGGSGDDILSGGDGKDILVGNGGSDTFVIQNVDFEDRNIIRDFEDGTDKLFLSPGLAFSELDISNNSVGTSTNIRDNTGEIIAVLNGVDASAIDISDFDLIGDF